MWSVCRFGKPNAYAVLVQIKTPETSVPTQKLNSDLNFSGRDFARPHNPATSAGVFALENECAARLNPLAQRADPGPGRTDIERVYQQVGSLLGNSESDNHLSSSGNAVIQRSCVGFTQHSMDRPGDAEISS